MITDILLNFLFGFVTMVLTPFEWTMQIPATVFNVANEIFAMVGFFLPISQLMPIIIVFIALMAFRIAVSVIKTIWDLLPLV